MRAFQLWRSVAGFISRVRCPWALTSCLGWQFASPLPTWTGSKWRCVIRCGVFNSVGHMMGSRTIQLWQCMKLLCLRATRLGLMDLSCNVSQSLYQCRTTGVVLWRSSCCIDNDLSHSHQTYIRTFCTSKHPHQPKCFRRLEHMLVFSFMWKISGKIKPSESSCLLMNDLKSNSESSPAWWGYLNKSFLTLKVSACLSIWLVCIVL